MYNLEIYRNQSYTCSEYTFRIAYEYCSSRYFHIMISGGLRGKSKFNNRYYNSGFKSQIENYGISYTLC